MTPALETRGLSIGYRRRRGRDVTLAPALDLRLRRGLLIGLLGPNGIGKSTLLRTLAGMQAPLAGQVRLNDKCIESLSPEALARQLSLVLTTAPPAELMNGYALAALGRQPHTDWLGRMTAEDHAAVRWALEAAGAADLAEARVRELSDGQRQKLMIARALAQQGEIMLLDEPTAYLDLPRRVETMQLLQDIAHDSGRAILVSTHDLDLALRHCDRLWLMSEAGIAAGAPEDLALDGRLGQTFQAAGISFDAGSAAFVLNGRPGTAVHVAGEGLQAQWMRRALERRGYAPQPGPQAITITPSRKGRAGWQLTMAERSSSHRTIQALLDALERESA